jgi:hypothetical protein
MYAEDPRVGATVLDASGALARAEDPRVTTSELMSLAVHADPRVRAAVATRADCPVGALISLAHDHRPEVLVALIANSRTPSSAIRNLADSRHPNVAAAAELRLRSVGR